jgi:hypothetical protein
MYKYTATGNFIKSNILEKFGDDGSNPTLTLPQFLSSNQSAVTNTNISNETTNTNVTDNSMQMHSDPQQTSSYVDPSTDTYNMDPKKMIDELKDLYRTRLVQEVGVADIIVADKIIKFMDKIDMTTETADKFLDDIYFKFPNVSFKYVDVYSMIDLLKKMNYEIETIIIVNSSIIKLTDPNKDNSIIREFISNYIFKYNLNDDKKQNFYNKILSSYIINDNVYENYIMEYLKKSETDIDDYLKVRKIKEKVDSIIKEIMLLIKRIKELNNRYGFNIIRNTVSVNQTTDLYKEKTYERCVPRSKDKCIKFTASGFPGLASHCYNNPKWCDDPDNEYCVRSMNPLINQGDPCDGSMDYEEAKRQMELQESNQSAVTNKLGNPDSTSTNITDNSMDSTSVNPTSLNNTQVDSSQNISNVNTTDNSSIQNIYSSTDTYNVDNSSDIVGLSERNKIISDAQNELYKYDFNIEEVKNIVNKVDSDGDVFTSKNLIMTNEILQQNERFYMKELENRVENMKNMKRKSTQGVMEVIELLFNLKKNLIELDNRQTDIDISNITIPTQADNEADSSTSMNINTTNNNVDTNVTVTDELFNYCVPRSKDKCIKWTANGMAALAQTCDINREWCKNPENEYCVGSMLEYNQEAPCDGSMDFEEAKKKMTEIQIDTSNSEAISSTSVNINTSNIEPEVVTDDDVNSYNKFCLKNPNDENDKLCIDYDTLKMIYELKTGDFMGTPGPQGLIGPQGPMGPMGPIRKAQKFNYKKMENSMIEGENTMKLSYISPNECSSVCDKAEWCRSFDYNQEYKSCNLSSANRDTSVLKPSTQYNYYEKGEIN